jgi:hypothetical protein
MRSSWLFLVLLSALSLGAPARCAAAPQAEPLVEQVRRAIDRGVQYLREKQVSNSSDGTVNWEIYGDLSAHSMATSYPGGTTCLALLALMNAGVKPDDPIVQGGLKYIRALQPNKTYVRSLQTMVFALAGDPRDITRIQENVDWLVDAWNVNNRDGWTYEKIRAPPGQFGGADNSNTQYALLGLHDGHQAGAHVDQRVWKEIRSYYERNQAHDGGWYYRQQISERLTMTTAGLCGLLISGRELNGNREKILPDGTAENCGYYPDDHHLQMGLNWIGQHFRLETGVEQRTQIVYYNLYGIERAGRLSGRRFFGDHDWYREGCEYLVRHQSDENGSWRGAGMYDSWPTISTSFALLFLSKGRTPVLISKLTHGPDQDWNNDRNDARNLVEYASRELFKKQPLAWQIFEGDRRLKNNESREELLGAVGELLQSPIAYMNGHQVPTFSGREEEMLKEYIEQGGFLFAEACCGRKEFDAGFRRLMHQLFPESELKELSPDHAVWHAHFPIPPGAFKLYGIERGCKTVVIYSPQDLSCLWEANDAGNGRGKLAFELGGNIIAYATGMEMPKPRLTQADIVSDRGDERKPPRGYLKVVQLKHDGDWQPAPQAMHNLMAHLRDGPRLDVSVQAETMPPGNPSLLDFKFMYLHGRRAFHFDESALANIRANLQTGGLLLADACCGKKEFDGAFRRFAQELFPDKKLERIPLSDDLFSQQLNGEAITSVRCRRENADGTGAEATFHDYPPLLEGIKINNRWVVIYSRYDLGCALEKHQSTDCLGHDFASAVKLASAAVFYAVQR